MERQGDGTPYPPSATDTFPGLDGVMLHERWWRPQPEPRAGIVLLHGLAEHSGRYVPTARYLLQHGFAVDSFDLRGHGRSGGSRLLVHSFDQYLDDLDLYLDRVRARLPGRPLFLLGHSMGGVIAILYALERTPRLRGVILSAPAVHLSNEVSPLLQKTASALSRFLPRLKTVKINSRFVSRDPDVVAAYDNDPLVYRKGVLLRTGSELVRAGRVIRENPVSFAFPVLILQGTGDRITEPEGASRLYESLNTADRTLKLYEGLFHEILNEPEKERVLQDIVAWLNLHIRSDDR